MIWNLEAVSIPSVSLLGVSLWLRRRERTDVLWEWTWPEHPIRKPQGMECYKGLEVN
jgi:hypothetical protein